MELKDKQLRIEDALNATKVSSYFLSFLRSWYCQSLKVEFLTGFSQAAIEEGVVVGGGCSLLRLSTKVDGIKEGLDNEEQQVPLFA